jgi:hypothetical protein
MADARGVRRRVPVAAPARRGVKPRQLEPSVAVRGLHHRDLRPGALEPHDAVHPTALDRPPALQLSPSSTKNSVAAARLSTTMPTCSMRWIVMRSTVAERRPQLPRLSVADGYASLWRTLSETTVPA